MGTNDPLKLPRWTLPQTLAWTIFKTPEAVSWADGKEVFDVANETIRREVDDATRSAALPRRDELYDRLCDETLTAYGIGRGQSEHNPIPALAWPAIDCFYNYDGRCDAGPDDVYRAGESLPRYRDVFVRPNDVLRLWSLGEATSSKAGARSEAKAKAIRVRGPSLAERLSAELKAMYPSGRPAMRVQEIIRALAARPNIGEFGETTLKTAMRRAFPRGRRRSRRNMPKRA